jgi:tRNA pseudouridine38-40 synthase
MRKSKSWIKGKSKSKSWNKPESSRFQTKTNKQKIFSRFKLILEYEGTRYSGWQKQHNVRTVQGELIKACEKIFENEFIDLQGSGRTDSGVHALSQVAHLDVNTMLAPHIIQMKMNDLLPYDINILNIEKTNKNFHARHSAKSRSYLYQISKRRNAFEKNHIWWVKDKLEFETMKKASKLFIGMNDFSSFSDDDPEDKSTKVVIDDIELSEKEDLIFIRITGSHFIWKMVRRIVGILVEVGRGKMSDKDILFYLNNKSGEPAKYTAPPSGLFLEKVIY